MVKIKLAKQTGGKAGKGCNKTSTIQVFYDEFSNGNWFRFMKQFRFLVDSRESFDKALNKAKEFAKEKQETK